MGVGSVKYKGIINQIAQNHFKLNYLNRFLIDSSEEKYKVITKIKDDSKPLNYYCDVWRGLTTGDDSKYLSIKKIDNNYKKIIQGKHIDRYFIFTENLYVNYLPKKLDRPRPQYIFEKEEKLVSKFVGKNLSFAYDNEKLYVINTACLIFNKDSCEQSLKFFLSLLNSQLINFYFKLMFTDYRDAFPIIKSGHIEQLPIKNINLNNDKMNLIYISLVKLVDQMLSAKKQLQQAKTESDKNYLERKYESSDKRIDELVYELYGLTEEEIKIVEESIK